MGRSPEILRVSFAAVALCLAPLWALAGACDADAVALRGDWGEARFSVTVADDEDERAQGLMHVTELARSAGMLFVYDEEGPRRFWMRNTLIPLDMIFADATGTVQTVHINAQPLSERLIFGGDNIQYVLEVNGGVAEQMGIAPGSEMRHPAIDRESAVWPC